MADIHNFIYRAGDILIWRSTKINDFLLENLIFLKSFHCGIILTGKIFDQLAVKYLSPSHTYACFHVDFIYPIEYLVTFLKKNSNVSSVHLIHRTTGPDIPEWVQYHIFLHVYNLPITKNYQVYKYFIMCYTRLSPDNFESCNYRHHICTNFIISLLSKYGLVMDHPLNNNILPTDLFDLRFYQKYTYINITLIQKFSHTYSSLFTLFLSNLFSKVSLIRKTPINF